MAPISFVSLVSSLNCASLLGASHALWELCTIFLVDWDLWVRGGMIRGERDLSQLLFKGCILSLFVHIHRGSGGRCFFGQLKEKWTSLSSGLGFFLVSQSSCSSEDRCITDDKQSQRFCPCKYRTHEKTQVEKFRWTVGVLTELCLGKAGKKSTSKMGMRVWAEAPWLNKVLVVKKSCFEDCPMPVLDHPSLPDVRHVNLVP